MMIVNDSRLDHLANPPVSNLIWTVIFGYFWRNNAKLVVYESAELTTVLKKILVKTMVSGSTGAVHRIVKVARAGGARWAYQPSQAQRSRSFLTLTWKKTKEVTPNGLETGTCLPRHVD